MLGIGVVYLLFYMYKNLGFEISYQYLPGGSELTNEEIILEVKLLK